MSNKSGDKNWSVILLMAVGILMVTVAGSIFISNTWKLLSQTTKEFCLAAVTIGVFVGSHFARKKANLAITGRALYYLAVVGSGFTSFMILRLLEDSVNVREFDAFRYALAFLLMMFEMAWIYFSERKIFDVIAAYILTGLVIINFSIAFRYSFGVILILFAIEALILSINNMLLRGSLKENTAADSCSYALYLITTIYTTLGLMGKGLVTLFDGEDFGMTTSIAVILIASLLVAYAGRRDTASRVLGCILVIPSLFNIYIDIVVNLDIVPGYLFSEFFALVAILYIFIIKFFWHDVNGAKSNVDVVSFVISCMIALGLLGHNIEAEEITCVMILGIASVIVLIFSSIKNNRKFQLLSGVTLGLMAIYLTRAFWASIAWWVYLLVAGIVCIVIAILKEKKIDNNPVSEVKPSENAPVFKEINTDADFESFENTNNNAINSEENE